MPDATRYARLRAAGLCPCCGDVAATEGVYCYGCRGRLRETNRKSGAGRRRLARFVAEQRCVDCGKQKPDVRGKVPRCDACRAAFADYRTRLRAARRRLGLCVECGKEPANGHYRGLGPHCSERHSRSRAKRRAG